LQGRAIYAYNDAVFSQDDWKGIRMLQDSIKENDPMKVGRFGLDFKSVLHMTGETTLDRENWHYNKFYKNFIMTLLLYDRVGVYNCVCC